MTLPIPPTLRSFERTLDPSPSRLARLESSEVSTPLSTLQTRYREHGYLWLRGMLPRTAVLEFRRHFFSAFSDTGLLEPGSDPVEGFAAGAALTPLVQKRHMELVRSAAYEAFCLHPRLWRFLDGFLDGMSYLHKRKMIRYTLPGDLTGTPAHYDLIYLRGGTDRLVTAWIPLGDIPSAMGGLVYLEGSHGLGQRMEAEFAALNATLSPEERVSAYNRNMTEGGWVSKDLPDMAQRFDARWLWADYEAGDVLLHSPYMIHAATANTDPRRMRLSTDIRYQNLHDEIDVRWNNHWTLNDML